MARSATRTPTTAPQPDWVAPQLTQLVDAAPDGDGWLHEIKYDGYRMHARSLPTAATRRRWCSSCSIFSISTARIFGPGR